MHAIRAVSRLTGISPHTLRMWERRYGFPSPIRSEGGSRRYSDADVERLRLCARAVARGYRPREVVPRPLNELEQMLALQTEPDRGLVPDVDDILEALSRSDEGQVHELLQRAVATRGPRGFVTEVAAPLCTRVGEQWERGELEVHHEHLLSEALTTYIRVLLSAYVERDGRPRVLLCTLPDELHGLGLQMAALYLALAGAAPRLIGVSTPVIECVAAAHGFSADAVGISIAEGYDAERARGLLRELLEQLPRRTELWLGGAGAAAIGLDGTAGVRRADGWSRLDDALAAWRHAHA